MRDILPGDMARFRVVEEAFRSVCLGWGYEEVRTPTVEHLFLFTSAGTLSPQMLDRVYSFLDWDGWSGERVVLRPDSTIPVARMYSELAEPGEVWKRFYVQSVLRFAPADEAREDWQCGVELIGDTQPVGDVELVLMASEVLRRLGVSASLRLSHPGIVTAVLAAAGYENGEQLALYDRLLEGDFSVLDEAAERVDGLGSTLRALLSIEGEGAAYINNLVANLSGAVPQIEAPLNELLAISETLSGVGVAHSISPLLVRNFEYYTGPVFDLAAGAARVGGGGRYDRLIGLVGDSPVPASGFALDVDAITPLVESIGDREIVVALRPAELQREALAATFALAGALQQAGVAFRITGAAEPAASREAVAGANGYTLRLNGSQPRSYGDADEVVRALATSSQ